VLIAACLSEHEHHGRALPVLQAIHDGKAAGFASAHTLLEMYAILTRLPRSPRLNPLQAANLIEENVSHHFTVAALTGREYAELIEKLSKQGSAGGQAYDALHLACARKSGADRFYTLNVRHFQALAGEGFRDRIVAP
jgi:predicted nucleic acid-binding protein